MVVTPAAIAAAVKAARDVISAYSPMDNAMIPDAALEAIVSKALAAGVAVLSPPTTKGTS